MSVVPVASRASEYASEYTSLPTTAQTSGGTPGMDRKSSEHSPKHEYPVNWRGFGGGVPTLSSVLFDRQLDKISLWLENWTHEERCAVLEKILAQTKDSQCKFLWTVMQPSMHRDFMYTAKKEFPSQQFTPISTHSSREHKKKLILMHQTNYHRIRSAHLQGTDQVKTVIKDIQLPDIKGSTQTLNSVDTSVSGKWKNAKSSQNQKAVTFPKLYKSTSTLNLSVRCEGENREGLNPAAMFDGLAKSSLQLINTAPPCFRFIEMPVRRHIQDEQNSAMIAEPLERATNSQSSKISDTSLRSNNQKRKGGGLVSLVNDTSLPEEGCQLIEWYDEHWTDVQRNDFLHKFLLKLDPRQHYFISSLLAIKQYRDFVSLLPEDLAYEILAYLKPKRIVICSRVNKRWYKLCNSNELWRRKCNEINLGIPVTINKPDWQKVFRENLNVKRNWQSGRCSVVDCRGHTDRVLSIAIDGHKMATGSKDKTIRVWNLQNGRCTHTLKGHVKGVWFLKFFTSTLLISGSFDSSIKIWNLRDSSCTRTLLGHEGPVWAIVRRDNILVSASQDFTAKVWDVSRCKLLQTLEGHSAAVFAVDMDEEGTLVITGSADRSVRIWDPFSGKQLRSLWPSQTTSIMSVSYSKGYIACCYSQTLLLYKLGSDYRAKLLKTWNEHHDRIESVQLKIKHPKKCHGTMVSAGKDGTIKYWDVTRHGSVQTFTGHNKQINCVFFDEVRIASASYDNRVKIWDFNVPPPRAEEKSAMTSVLLVSEAPDYYYRHYDEW